MHLGMGWVGGGLLQILSRRCEGGEGLGRGCGWDVGNGTHTEETYKATGKGKVLPKGRTLEHLASEVVKQILSKVNTAPEKLGTVQVFLLIYLLLLFLQSLV